ncbi:AzlC family ABC transporter permease [Pseudorhodobacter sp.]|uniref:AzlC family ABC transporter permease n=1 Tax=Pseudorhodobacter sp. TaxID=1934400 RepID=UPI00264A0A9F|nr:AzlC family ABC transporter permease [Pseudorhodobacter sp.]MDN5788573.1 AzlC family ABC transporter permease [Pseudorhodobacter sp.]
MQTPLQDLRAGFRDVLPLALGAALYGLAFGLLAAQAGMSVLQTGVMGSIVFSGSAQFVAVERLVAGAGAFTALVAGGALNLRILLMTASLRDVLAGRPFWQVLLGVHMTGDESWALLHATRATGRAVGYWYLVGAGACMMVAWVSATSAGAAFAAVLPEPHAMGIDFAFTAAFIAILRGLWSGRRDALPWIASAITVASLALLTPLEPSWALVAGGILGAVLAGVWGKDA